MRGTGALARAPSGSGFREAVAIRSALPSTSRFLARKKVANVCILGPSDGSIVSFAGVPLPPELLE